MKRTIAVVGAFASLAAATAVQAADIHRITVVNAYDAPMEVYAEDANGGLHPVAHLKVGEVKLVEADLETVSEGRVRLHARPTNSTNRLSTWGDKGIVTDRLRLSDDDTAILWIAPILAESSVEIRPS